MSDMQDRINSHPLDGLKAARPGIEAAWEKVTPTSAALMARARNVFPGGYTRDAVIRAPYPAFLAKAEGSILTDADGRQIRDFWFNATSLPLGHCHPEVTAAVMAQIARGTAWYGPAEVEIELAEEILARLPGAERLRFTNSGSEAVMMALRFARAATGRETILKFEGSYHGAHDDVQWSITPAPGVAGPADAPAVVPASGGLAAPGTRVAVLPWGDADVLEAWLARNHSHTAAILVEPMANKMGMLLPPPGFLAAARSLCDRYGIVLIFDEVISFRTGYNGAQGLTGVAPDLTTLGKIIGGGYPVGAVAGKAAVLDLSDGRKGRVAHAGTFNANPVTATAGLATLRALTPVVFDGLASRAAALRSRLKQIIGDLPVQVTGTGSLFKLTALAGPLRNWRDQVQADTEWEEALSLALLHRGFLLTPQLQGCLSTATTDDDCDALAAALTDVLAETSR